MTLIRFVDNDGNPEYFVQEDVCRIAYHDGYKRVLVDLGEAGTFSAPAELSVDEVKAAIDEAGLAAQFRIDGLREREKNE